MPQVSNIDAATAKIDRIARLSRLANEGKRKIEMAKIDMTMGRCAAAPFFGVFAYKMRSEFNEKSPGGINPTACTDGKKIYWNPEFLDKLSREQTLGVLAHEIMHVSNAHHARAMGRDQRLWNIAADLAVNYLLLEAGFKLPPGVCVPEEAPFENYPKGLSAEAYYARLERDPNIPKYKFVNIGGMLPPASQAAAAAAAAQAQVWTAQAAAACKGQGSLPGFVARQIEQVLHPRADWTTVLRRFVSSIARNDFTWTPPSRKAWANGMTLPGMRSEEIGDLLVCIDTSGSIGQDTLDKFAAEAQGILDAYAVKLTILYCDDAVDEDNIVQWSSTDGDLHLKGSGAGGGGTSHEPIWAWLKKQDQEPKAIVCLTDMATSFGEDPGIPVLWASVGAGEDPEAPFGEVVVVEA